MKQIQTEIEINASPERVWQILTDFEAYPSWNPFVKRIAGKAQKGEQIEIFVQPEGSGGMTFRPTVLESDAPREFRWLGRLFFSGLFDGEHYFIIEPVAENKVRFIHGEKFTGILVGLFMWLSGEGTLRGFKAMNEALKNRAEVSAKDEVKI